jgi:hypothetical protein
MERRILVNYRVDPDVLGAYLPHPFRPALVDGWGVAGICLIRLGAIRPAGLARVVGLHAENAAHRVAVCWDGAAGPVTGVYIPRRDTSSRLAAMAGGRAFPGFQHLARFTALEGGGSFRVEVASGDGAVRVVVDAHVAGRVMAGSVFADVDAASRFFRAAPVGYAATPTDGVFDGVELDTNGWDLRPLAVDEVVSSFFEDGSRFPPGTAMLDSAFLMSGLATTWRPQPILRAGTALAQPVAP